MSTSGREKFHFCSARRHEFLTSCTERILLGPLPISCTVELRLTLKGAADLMQLLQVWRSYCQMRTPAAQLLDRSVE